MAQIPHADPGKICPLHRRDMAKVCHLCPWWGQVRGKHPQSEQEFDQWHCAIAFLPMLLIDNAQQTRQAGAAVESARNQAVRQGVALHATVAQLHADLAAAARDFVSLARRAQPQLAGEDPPQLIGPKQ